MLKRMNCRLLLHYRLKCQKLFRGNHPHHRLARQVSQGRFYSLSQKFRISTWISFFFRVLKDLLVLNFSGNFGAFLIAYLKFFKNFFLAPHSSVLSFIIGKVRFVFYSDFFTLLSICSVEHKPISLYTIKSYVLWPWALTSADSDILKQ